jgi:hypothetical protein
MEDFIATLDEPIRADRLGIAIEGRGAFRRFKDTISRWARRAGALVPLL